MALRIILGLLTVAAIFGQSPPAVKAGDPAPGLTWTRILSGGDPGSFAGHVTVIGFFPALSPNATMVSQWNQLAGKFAGQPIRFVWITSEYQPSLGPWLEEHPVSGCLLLDPLGATAKAYGVEFGGAIVDSIGRIAGFTFILPGEEQVRAVQEGRAARLDSEPHRMSVPEGKPDIPASWEVRISPSHTNGTEENQGPDWWIQRGFTLKAVIAKVYDQDPSRIVLPKALENEKCYDFVLVPPGEVDRTEMHRLVRQAIEEYFHLSAMVESRPADVYVMSALAGKTPPAKSGDDNLGGSIGWTSGRFTITTTHGSGPPTEEMLREAMKVAAMSAISAENTNMADFRRALEDGLERPIVDETKLDGSYDFEVHGEASSTEEFLGMLRDQLGLVLTPERRNIEMLVVQ